MKFPNKTDYFGKVDDYLDAVVTTCLTIHKEHINDSLVQLTGGKITKEQQEMYFIGKQLFSDEPIYKLMRLITNYRNDKYINEKDDIMLTIIGHVELAEKYVSSISKVNHDEELRNMVTMMIDSGRSVKQIAEELCDTGWYNYDNADSLERVIHGWINKYNLK
jgi:hypothetical protein